MGGTWARLQEKHCGLRCRSYIAFTSSHCYPMAPLPVNALVMLALMTPQVIAQTCTDTSPMCKSQKDTFGIDFCNSASGKRTCKATCGRCPTTSQEYDVETPYIHGIYNNFALGMVVGVSLSAVMGAVLFFVRRRRETTPPEVGDSLE